MKEDDNSAASNNSDTDDEDYVENVAAEENISSDDEEIDEIQRPSTSRPEVKWSKLYIKKNRSPPEFAETYPRQNRRWSVQEMLSLQYQKRRSSLSMAVSVLQRTSVLLSKGSYLL
ncbi:hypothetical protein TNIN_261161 [Trichonephila inaurata madagascariensis]|uniref:Uncharacterized protein n=1 Tax=Trichonephila inaurata madagascariensis TaxID=2747483 RepID=A0A8X6MBM0_9ARAC|nr:hypothetical protein TNIN_261161 [Trichonephila inaurata madagascariensis]